MPAMLNIPPEDQAELEQYLAGAARILRQHTAQALLKSFESIEIEVREQMIEIVAPKIGEFFFQKGESKCQERQES